MSTPRPNPLFRDQPNSQPLISLISRIWGPSPVPTADCFNTRWHVGTSLTVTWALATLQIGSPNVPLSAPLNASCLLSGLQGVSQSAVCVSHGCVYRLDLTSMRKQSPLGQICGCLVPFRLTTTLGRNTHTHTDSSLSYYRVNCSNDRYRIGLLRLYRQFWPATLRLVWNGEGKGWGRITWYP